MTPSSFLYWLMEAGYYGAILIAVVLMLVPLVRRYCGARAAHLLWLPVLVRLLVPGLPGSPLDLPVQWSNRLSEVPQSASRIWVTATLEDARSFGVFPSHAPQPGIFIPLPLRVWALGASIMLIVALARALRARTLVRRACDVDTSTREYLSSLVPLPPDLRICETDELRTPALCGLFRPAILMPIGWAEKMDSGTLRGILAHEIGHFRRHDLLWRWGFLVAKTVHWFNPLVWLAERVSRDDQEMACDEWVLQQHPSSTMESYGEALLAAASVSGRSIPTHVGMAESRVGLRRRIHWLTRIRPRSRTDVVTAVAFALILLVFIAPVKSQAPASPPLLPFPEDPATSQSLPVGSEANIEIESRFIEVRSAAAAQLVGGRPDNDLALQTILDSEQYLGTLKLLDKLEGADLLSAPKVTTRSGQRANIQIVREFRYPTEFGTSKNGPGFAPTTFETQPVGVTLEVVPTAMSDGNILLRIAPEIVEFMGFVNFGADLPARPSPDGDAIASAMKGGDSTRVINQPVFAKRKLVTNVSLKSGQTALIGGICGLSNRTVDFVAKGNSTSQPSYPTELYLYITARIIPQGNPPHPPRPRSQSTVQSKEGEGTNQSKATPTPTPQSSPSHSLKASDLPYGTPVPDKPGFITSPYAPDKGYVDVRGFPPSTEVKCPYSGKIFLVP